MSQQTDEVTITGGCEVGGVALCVGGYVRKMIGGDQRTDEVIDTGGCEVGGVTNVYGYVRGCEGDCQTDASECKNGI